MYSIEAMPHKIKIESVLSDSKEQALLGDPYDIKLKMSILEDVHLKSLKAYFINFSTSQPKDGSAEAQMDGVRSADHSEMDMMASAVQHGGMVDVDLSQTVDGNSFYPLTRSIDDGSKYSRLSASMFSPNMSSFYQNARSMISSSQAWSNNAAADLKGAGAPISQSLFLGADPSIGVAVLKRSLTGAKRERPAISNIGGGPAVGDLIGSIGEVDEETDFQSVELFYTRGDLNSESDLKNIIVDDEQPNEDKIVDLLNNEGKIDDLNLKMIFY